MRFHHLAAFIALTAATAPGAARAGASDYRFDTVHTQIVFAVSHLGFSRPTGRFHVKSGFIHFDTGDWSSAQVDAEIDTTSLDMGDAAWNAKLRSWEFFGTDKHPIARYVSGAVEKSGDHGAIVHGRLTLCGVTRPLDLAVTFNRAGVDSYSLHYTIGFSATATLKRSDFGMKKYLPDVGDDVSLHIEVEGLRDRSAQEQAGQPQDQESEHDGKPEDKPADKPEDSGHQ